jgi:hypothetical protein
MSLPAFAVEQEDGTWKATFSSFHENEAPQVADDLATFYDQHSVWQIDILNWNSAVESVVNHLYGKGFVFMENKDGHGNIVHRAIYKKRVDELRF